MAKRMFNQFKVKLLSLNEDKFEISHKKVDYVVYCWKSFQNNDFNENSFVLQKLLKGIQSLPIHIILNDVCN